MNFNRPDGMQINNNYSFLGFESVLKQNRIDQPCQSTVVFCVYDS